MNKLMRDYGTYALAVVIVLAGIVLFSTRHKRQNSEMPAKDVNMATSGKPASPAPAAPEKSKANAWDGMLQKSADAAKGNYVLVTKDHSMYLKTSRDFSALVGKKVHVTYDGTLDRFVLGDITAIK